MLTFFKINCLHKFFQEHYQMVWILVKTSILLVLLWIQTVRKGYQQTIKFTASKERVKGLQKL